MSWTTAIVDLRTLLSDQGDDRYHYRKRCFGLVNGTNRQFKTFEFRRVTDFTTATLPLGVYKNGILLAVNKISSDYPGTGDFVLATAPIDGDEIEASYYTQWFLDAELDTFLKDAALWLLSTNDYTLISGGLISAAKKYAAAEAYLKMAQRWRTYASEAFKVEDAPKGEADAKTDSFTAMSKTFREEALKARDEYYTRQGRPLQPLYGTVLGNVRPMP